TDEVLDARFLRVLFGFLDADRVDIDADPARAVRLGRRDHDTAVAASEVVNNVGLRHSGEFEHRLYGFFGRGDVGNVGVAARLGILRRSQGREEKEADERFPNTHRRKPLVSEGIAKSEVAHAASVQPRAPTRGMVWTEVRTSTLNRAPLYGCSPGFNRRQP